MVPVAKGVKLEHALSVYTYEFLTREARAWVARCASDPAITTDLDRFTHVVTTQGVDEAHLRQTLAVRSPVYMGGHSRSMYDEAALRRVHGHGTAEVNVANMVRHAIVAPNYAAGAGLDAPSAALKDWRFFTIHVMGVNLESPDTADYARFVGRNGELLEAAYAAEVRTIFAMIRGAVDAVVAAHGGTLPSSKHPHVRMPCFGLGAYLSALFGGTDAARAAFMSALAWLACSRPEWTLELVMYEGVEPWAINAENPPNLWLTDGNLFDVAEHMGAHLFLVNAWDTVSFVGNGGARDYTVDGMMVAGIAGGSQLINCSYLHNLFFRSQDPNIVYVSLPQQGEKESEGKEGDRQRGSGVQGDNGPNGCFRCCLS